MIRESSKYLIRFNLKICAFVPAAGFFAGGSLNGVSHNIDHGGPPRLQIRRDARVLFGQGGDYIMTQILFRYLDKGGTIL